MLPEGDKNSEQGGGRGAGDLEQVRGEGEGVADGLAGAGAGLVGNVLEGAEVRELAEHLFDGRLERTGEA